VSGTPTTVIYRGYLAEHDHGEGADILFLTSISEPLAEKIKDDLSEYGRYCSVNYYITDAETTIGNLRESLVLQIVGAGDASFRHRYSEITGYLWTDEEVNVGGHDLLEELRGYLGKFCHLEITFSEEPRD
jgi:hypothetical protein